MHCGLFQEKFLQLEKATKAERETLSKQDKASGQQVCVCACVHVCVYVCVHACVCVYVCVCVIQ